MQIFFHPADRNETGGEIYSTAIAVFSKPRNKDSASPQNRFYFPSCFTFRQKNQPKLERKKKSCDRGT